MKAFKKALIIDDDDDLCLMLKSIILDVVPIVQCAQSIATGKQVLAQFTPDVIFLDNNLPDGQGMQLIKEIKGKHPAAFIIFITALDSQRELAMENGIDIFLEKPFTYSAVHQALSEGAKERGKTFVN